MKKRRGLQIIISIIIVLVLLAILSGFIINIEWFREVGYLGVFLTSLRAKAIIFVPTFIALTLIIKFYIQYLKKGYLTMGEGTVIYDKKQLAKQNRIITLASIIISFIISILFTNTFWYQILEFTNSTSFNIKDPIFNKDVGFYIFKLPLIESIFGMLILVIIILIGLTLIFYTILKARDGIVNLRGFIKGVESNEVRFIARQLAVFGGILLLLLAGVFYIKTLNLVYSPRGVAFGTSYTDAHVTIPAYRIISIFCILSAFIVGYSIIKKRVRWIIYTGILLVVLIAGQGAVSELVQKLIVDPNSMEKEMPYLTYNINATRNAFGLDNIEERNFNLNNNLTQKDVNENKDTVDNIRINEFSQVLEVYNQIQAIRSYYKFNDVDIDRYNVNGSIRQVLTSARELDNSSMETRYQTWQNRHLFYTHGYGAVMSFSNAVNSAGIPEFLLRDIPATGEDIKVTRPQIYFGELSNDYIITGAKSDEIDYPSGNENKKSRYNGSAGIRLTPLNRFLFAVGYRSLNFFLSQDITSDSKIILNRNIVNRVEKIAPFINYDEDPYLVISNGKLYWIIDGYTTTNRYPFSEPYNGINYIRNSVKVVVDAYNGNVDFYLYDKSDAIASTIGKIYKGIFKDISQMPEDLKSHIRYSEDVFMVQAKVYEKYHMKNPATFYNNDDLWTVAKYRTQDNKDVEVEPVYQVMRLPGDKSEEFLLTIPYTVARKENMVSLLAVRMDENNINMVATKFPKEVSVYGPQQFNSKINTDTSISSQLTLWGQQGSQVILGETNIIPIKNSIIYVRPLYLKAKGEKSVPELKKVIVGYSDKIVMENNIHDAFARLFNINTGEQSNNQVNETEQDYEKDNINTLIKDATDLFNKAKEAQTKGDWASYGKYLKDLENVLNQLNSNVK